MYSVLYIQRRRGFYCNEDNVVKVLCVVAQSLYCFPVLPTTLWDNDISVVL